MYGKLKEEDGKQINTFTDQADKSFVSKCNAIQRQNFQVYKKIGNNKKVLNICSLQSKNIISNGDSLKKILH